MKSYITCPLQQILKYGAVKADKSLENIFFLHHRLPHGSPQTLNLGAILDYFLCNMKTYSQCLFSFINVKYIGKKFRIS